MDPSRIEKNDGYDTVRNCNIFMEPWILSQMLK